jgi:hypothetical protein
VVVDAKVVGGAAFMMATEQYQDRKHDVTNSKGIVRDVVAFEIRSKGWIQHRFRKCA